MNPLIKLIAVLVLTAILTAGSVLMVGPQIMIIAPVALLAGIIFAFLRSFMALVCLGYPFTFGLISAFIGRLEITGYERTSAFAVSIGIGAVGIGLIAVGLWKALPDGTTRETSLLA